MVSEKITETQKQYFAKNMMCPRSTWSVNKSPEMQKQYFAKNMM